MKRNIIVIIIIIIVLQLNVCISFLFKWHQEQIQLMNYLFFSSLYSVFLFSLLSLLLLEVSKISTHVTRCRIASVQLYSLPSCFVCMYFLNAKSWQPLDDRFACELKKIKRKKKNVYILLHATSGQNGLLCTCFMKNTINKHCG